MLITARILNELLFFLFKQICQKKKSWITVCTMQSPYPGCRKTLEPVTGGAGMDSSAEVTPAHR